MILLNDPASEGCLVYLFLEVLSFCSWVSANEIMLLLRQYHIKGGGIKSILNELGLS